MDIKNTFTKSLTFFSRTKQEDLVSKIEHQFYKAITFYNRDAEGRLMLHRKMEEIGNQIYNSISFYYFEDDLLEYMFSLGTFIMNYTYDVESGLLNPHGDLKQKFAELEKKTTEQSLSK